MATGLIQYVNPSLTTTHALNSEDEILAPVEVNDQPPWARLVLPHFQGSTFSRPWQQTTWFLSALAPPGTTQLQKASDLCFMKCSSRYTMKKWILSQ